jgi:hypothetical protein
MAKIECQKGIKVTALCDHPLILGETPTRIFGIQEKGS